MEVILNYLDIKRYEGWLIQNSSYKDSRPCDRIDYSYKAKLLNTDICKRVGELNWELFLNSNENSDYAILDSYDIQKYFDKLYEKYGVSAILEGNRINNAKFHRVARLRKRITDIFDSPCENVYFLTFTFSDQFLDSDNFSKRRYVQRFLKTYFYNYVGNVDFGKINGRVHFHAVACCDWFDPNLWHFGNLDYEKVIIRDSSNEKLSKYITKLVNHAIKETTKRNSLIYKRLSTVEKNLDTSHN